MRFARLLALVLVVSACAVLDSGPDERGLDSRPEPPPLIVTDAEGEHSLPSSNYCWDYREGPGLTSVCTEAVGRLGDLPTFTLTDDTTITLNFQYGWDQVSASVRPEDGSCDTYLIEFIEPRGFVFHELGPSGEYVVELDALAERGDAHWMIRIDNRADLPYPEDANCS